VDPRRNRTISPGIRLEDKAALRGHFDLTPDSTVVPVGMVAPRTKATEAERAKALREITDGPANPVAGLLHPDGSVEVETDAELSAARQLGLNHLAVVPTLQPEGRERVGTPELVARVPFHETGDLDRFNRNLIENPRSANLSIHWPGEGHERHLFLSPDGLAGFAIDDTGDLQNVHNNGAPGVGKAAVVAAIEAGARTLDAYDGFLPRFYSRFGFREVVRQKFNDEYAPPGWEAEFGTRPDVVHMSPGDAGAS